MRSKWTFSVLIVMAVPMLALAVWSSWPFSQTPAESPRLAPPPKPRIDSETYQRLELGMNLEQIEAMVGAPPGDYVNRLYGIYGGAPPKQDGRAVEVYRHWISARWYLAVGFAEDGTACNVSLYRVSLLRKPTFWERLWYGGFPQSDDG